MKKKKNLIFIGLGIILMGFAIINFTFEIDNKGHYFVNGIICGVGLSITVLQILRIRKGQTGKND